MTLKVACVQSDIIARNPSENFKHLDELFTRIQDDRDIIILPETFTTGFPAEPELFAEDENGATMTWLRKKAKVSDEVEYFSNMRTLESVRRSDLSLLVLDVTRGLEVQDFRIITEIRKAGKGLIILLNKWDILPNKTEKSFDHIVKDILEREPLLEYVPILSISAKEGQRLHRVIQEIRTVYENCHRVIGRERLAEVFSNLMQQNPHPSRQSRAVVLKRACQVMVEPPVISIETRTPELVDESYKRFLMKRFFEEFQLMGAPLRLNFDQKLILRKDEDLEQFTLSSNSVSAGVDSNSGLGRKNHTRNRHPSLRQQERRSNKRF